MLIDCFIIGCQECNFARIFTYNIPEITVRALQFIFLLVIFIDLCTYQIFTSFVIFDYFYLSYYFILSICEFMSKNQPLKFVLLVSAFLSLLNYNVHYRACPYLFCVGLIGYRRWPQTVRHGRLQFSRVCGFFILVWWSTPAGRQCVIISCIGGS